MLFTLHDSVYKEHQQQRISDCWNEITHTHTHTHTHQRLWIGAEWPLLYTKFSKQKAISPPVLLSVSTAVLTLPVAALT